MSRAGHGTAPRHRLSATGSPAGRRLRCGPRGALFATVSALLLSGCESSDARSNAAQINAALLATLSSGNKPLCVDSGTFGEPLAVFRTMLLAPDAVRRLLHWRAPGPLRPGRLLSGRELVNGELRDDPSVLPEYSQSDAHLPALAELQLDALARGALMVEPEGGVTLRRSAESPLATVRWWPLNRLDKRCAYSHTVSKPVIKRDIAFVTVTAAHQGTTYAFQRNSAGWRTIAQWSDWLY